MKKIFFLLLIVANSLLGQNTEQLFKEANDLYKNEKIEEAIELYKKIEAQGMLSSELYYNLGNSYYKLNKVGPSIYYYEKALKNNPLNEDVKNNLVFAKRLALDNIEEIPKTVFQKFHENWLQKLSYNQWAIVIIICSFLGSLLFLLFYFADSPSKKRFYFITSIFSFILLIFSFLITYNQYTFSKNNKVAIVFAEKTAVRNAPTLNSEEVFTLHEGTKVVVLDLVDDWKKIKLADGKLGWIIAEEIKEL
ncbi:MULTISPECIES: tetratricopeptide repeat protein [unclassified Polaribacter]|uniref:tetratricopeptide repeat protein n=1 Tax=unclassified Polaribacter TaxID=196858 RepID=UPI0011BF5F34|nr:MULTISPECIES: tetratricopeptide repeat protein [unclassified Polaribacter]TXD53498.1 SH3 domain-containing protein [Polaribacter sp. IC063]TXD58354.1 SH3 domain-containing protein [Polaribacter sp. IC066]